MKYDIHHVFEDFIAMSAIELSNPVDPLHREAREKQYIEIAKRYEKLEERQQFAEMFALLVQAHEEAERPTDILGPLFHALGLHDTYKGQFFTPSPVADMMSAITLASPELPKCGYHSLCEPTCGSGVMIMGFAHALDEQKHSHSHNMVVTAADLDIKCVHMTYVQMALWGIPGVVLHANSLTEQTYSRWYTPVYLLDGWLWREQCSLNSDPVPEDEQLRRVLDPMYAAYKDAAALLREVVEPAAPPEEAPQQPEPLTADANGQLSLF